MSDAMRGQMFVDWVHENGAAWDMVKRLFYHLDGWHDEDDEYGKGYVSGLTDCIIILAENDGFGFTYTELEMWVDGMTDDFFEED